MPLPLPDWYREPIDKCYAALGLPNPYKILDAFIDIDLDRIRRVGEQQWGLGNAEASRLENTLRDGAETIYTNLLKTVQDRWTDDGYRAYESYVKGLEKITEGIADQIPTVGRELVEFSERFEMSWYELIGIVTALTSVVLAILGLIAAALGLALAAAAVVVGAGAGSIAGPAGTVAGGAGGAVVGLVVAAVSAVLAILSAVIAFVGVAPAYFGTVQARMDLVSNTKDEIRKVTPTTVDVPGPTFAGKGWAAISEDPYS